MEPMRVGLTRRLRLGNLFKSTRCYLGEVRSVNLVRPDLRPEFQSENPVVRLIPPNSYGFRPNRFSFGRNAFLGNENSYPTRIGRTPDVLEFHLGYNVLVGRLRSFVTPYQSASLMGKLRIGSSTGRFPASRVRGFRGWRGALSVVGKSRRIADAGSGCRRNRRWE